VQTAFALDAHVKATVGLSWFEAGTGIASLRKDADPGASAATPDDAIVPVFLPDASRGSKPLARMEPSAEL